MLIKRYYRKKYISISLSSGYSGQGKTIYIVQTLRKGTTGRNIYGYESFKTKKEAEKWIRYAL